MTMMTFDKFLDFMCPEQSWHLLAIKDSTLEGSHYDPSPFRVSDATIWAKEKNDLGYGIYFAVNPCPGFTGTKAAKGDVSAATHLWVDPGIFYGPTPRGLSATGFAQCALQPQIGRQNRPLRSQWSS